MKKLDYKPYALIILAIFQITYFFISNEEILPILENFMDKIIKKSMGNRVRERKTFKCQLRVLCFRFKPIGTQGKYSEL